MPTATATPRPVITRTDCTPPYEGMKSSLPLAELLSRRWIVGQSGF